MSSQMLFGSFRLHPLLLFPSPQGVLRKSAFPDDILNPNLVGISPDMKQVLKSFSPNRMEAESFSKIVRQEGHL